MEYQSKLVHKRQNARHSSRFLPDTYLKARPFFLVNDFINANFAKTIILISYWIFGFEFKNTITTGKKVPFFHFHKKLLFLEIWWSSDLFQHTFVAIRNYMYRFFSFMNGKKMTWSFCICTIKYMEKWFFSTEIL